MTVPLPFRQDETGETDMNTLRLYDPAHASRLADTYLTGAFLRAPICYDTDANVHYVVARSGAITTDPVNRSSWWVRYGATVAGMILSGVSGWIEPEASWATTRAYLGTDHSIRVATRQIGAALSQCGLTSLPASPPPAYRPADGRAWHAGIAARRILAGRDVWAPTSEASLEDLQDESRAKAIIQARRNLADSVGRDLAARIEEQLHASKGWEAFLREQRKGLVRSRNDALALVSEQALPGECVDVPCGNHGEYVRLSRLTSHYGYRLITYRGRKGRPRALIYRSHAVTRTIATLRAETVS